MSNRPVHIGLNLIFLVPGQTGGMEVAARELIPELAAAAPQMRFTAFINRETAAQADGPWGDVVEAVTVPVNAANRVMWVAGEQTLLPLQAARAGVDLLHSMGSTAPLKGPFRRIVTIHDLIYARFPEAHPGIRNRGMRLLVPAAARHSHRVIADSQATRQDLISLLSLDPGLIDVVPLGIGSPQREQPLPEEDIRARFDLGSREVLLSLSAKRPHKNLLALIGALAKMPPQVRPMLVLPGYPTWHEQELRERADALGVAADLRLLGWISPPEVEGLWALARAFVFPSLYEGFGLPVLEAMARGVPVACSEASSLPEVAGDAALLFDPHDETQIAAVLERLLSEPELRERLIQRGLQRVGEFTWARSARATLDSYARALS
jgi:glycosyltransferase involved in cell wall biosynthesis